METAGKFDGDSSVDFPAADISVVWLSQRGAELKLTMHFSRMVDGPEQDLEVVFDNPLAFQWEDEIYGLIALPTELPHCLAPQWHRWVFPILTIDNSIWADRYAQRTFTVEEYEHKRVTHYAFIALNDLVHVLSIKPPTLRWVPPVDA
jgi:hypothetical protein